MKGTPSTRRKITKDEGRAIVNDLIDGFVTDQKVGGSNPSGCANEMPSQARVA